MGVWLSFRWSRVKQLVRWVWLSLFKWVWLVRITSRCSMLRVRCK